MKAWTIISFPFIREDIHCWDFNNIFIKSCHNFASNLISKIIETIIWSINITKPFILIKFINICIFISNNLNILTIHTIEWYEFNALFDLNNGALKILYTLKNLLYFKVRCLFTVSLNLHSQCYDSLFILWEFSWGWFVLLLYWIDL